MNTPLWNQLLPRLFLAPALVLAFQSLRTLFLPASGEWDQLAHFLGGMAVAISSWVVIDGLTQAKQLPIMPPSLLWLVLLGITALVGIAWEWIEYFGFMYAPSPINFQILYQDTIRDLFHDLLGAAAWCLALKNPHRAR